MMWSCTEMSSGLATWMIASPSIGCLRQNRKFGLGLRGREKRSITAGR